MGQTISDQQKINVFFRRSSNIYNAVAKSYNLHSLGPFKPWNLCKLTMPNESITAELGSIHQFLTSMSCVALALCECVCAECTRHTQENVSEVHSHWRNYYYFFFWMNRTRINTQRSKEVISRWRETDAHTHHYHGVLTKNLISAVTKRRTNHLSGENFKGSFIFY